MKIGFLCGSVSWGGLEMNVIRLARWLAQRSHSIFLYGTAGSPIEQEAIALGLPFRPFSRVGKYGGILSARRLQRLIRLDGVKILTVHTSADILVSSLAKRIAGIDLKLAFVQHMQIGSDKKDLIHTLEYRSLDAWVTPLKILADGVRRRTRLDPDKIHVIPYGIELARFTETIPKRDEARSALDLPLNEKIAGVVGRFDPKKGQDVLVRAARIVHERGYPLHILFVGEETRNEQQEYLQSVRELIDSSELTEFVHIRPFLDRIESAYAAMDIFVLTSHSETYGMVTIEAMASGRPVIVTDSGGSPGIVSDGVNGVLVRPEDPGQLADAICRLLDYPELARQLADRAREEAVATYSHENQCRLVEKLFSSLTAATR